MTFAEYKQAVAALPYGKRLPQAVYLFFDDSFPLPDPLGALIGQVRRRFAPERTHNLLKFHTESFKVSLLHYPDFFDDPHPALLEAVIVDLATGQSKTLSYTGKDSPPILHRKETMVPADHPLRDLFAALTAQEEELGLLKESSRIGFRRNWEEVLRSAGISFEGHRIIRNDASTSKGKAATTIEVHRHRTAMTRTELSKPVREALSLGVLTPGLTIFDYGCGHGSDVERLQELGFICSGWDPAHAPNESKAAADVVNLGFVLNVIEDPAERVDTLLAAWALTKKTLVVSTMVEGQEGVGTFKRQFSDGIVTVRSTFQKYFAQAELQVLIEETLQTDADAIGLGIFLVFRDPSERQVFLFSRIQRSPFEMAVHRRILRPDRPAARRRLVFGELYAAHPELLDAFWQRFIQLARVPVSDEFEHHPELVEKVGKPEKVAGLLLEEWGDAALNASRARREDDLLVYLALAQFRKAVPFGHLPEPIRRDIKHLVGSNQKARDAARELLYSAGDPLVIEGACGTLQFGWHTDDHCTIHRSLLDELPAVLRVYVHCSSIIYGNPRDADLIKIHKHSGKVTLQFYDDFDGKLLPELKLRVKVNLRSLRAQIFDHSTPEFRQLMPFKERFMSKNHPTNPALLRFSKKLRKLGLAPEATSNGIAPQHLASLLRSL